MLIPSFATVDPTKENDDLAAEGLARVAVGDRERGLELIHAAFANGLGRWLSARGTNLGLMSNAAGLMVDRDQRIACRDRLFRAFDLHRKEHRQAELWSVGYGRYARLAMFALLREGNLFDLSGRMDQEARAWLRRDLLLLVLALIGGHVALAAGRAYADEEPGWSAGAPSKGAAVEASILVTGRPPNPKDRWWDRQRESLAAWVWRELPDLRHELFSADELEALWLWAEQGEVAPELLALSRDVCLGSVLHVVGWEGVRVSWFEDGDAYSEGKNRAHVMAWGRDGFPPLFVVRKPRCGATRAEGGWLIDGQGRPEAFVHEPAIPGGAVHLVFDREGGRLVGAAPQRESPPSARAPEPSEEIGPETRPEVSLLTLVREWRAKVEAADENRKNRQKALDAAFASLAAATASTPPGPAAAVLAADISMRSAEQGAQERKINQAERRNRQRAAWDRLEAALR